MELVLDYCRGVFTNPANGCPGVEEFTCACGAGVQGLVFVPGKDVDCDAIDLCDFVARRLRSTMDQMIS